MQVSRQAVSKWESDAAYPETDKIIKIAQMFGVTCDYLLNDAPRYESDLVDKRNRDFLTMMISFSIACIAVGLVVAVICFYAISEWFCSLVGLGVLAGLFLAAFILWSVGRFKFLSSCSYSEEDKLHLAKWTKIFSYTAIIAFYCYLPSVVFIGLEDTLTINTTPNLIDISAKVFLKLPFGMFALSQLVFIPVGIAVARIISAVHDRQLGKPVSTVQLCDRICLTVILSALVCSFINITYAYYDYLNNPDWGWDGFWQGLAIIFLVSACIFAVTLIVQTCLHRKHEGANKKVFNLQISGAVFLVLNFAAYIATMITCNDVLFYINIVLGVALAAIATALIVLSVKDARQTDGARLNLLRYSIPCYAFALIQLSFQFDAHFGIMVWLALHCLITAIAGVVAYHKKTNNTDK